MACAAVAAAAANVAVTVATASVYLPTVSTVLSATAAICACVGVLIPKLLPGLLEVRPAVFVFGLSSISQLRQL